MENSPFPWLEEPQTEPEKSEVSKLALIEHNKNEKKKKIILCVAVFCVIIAVFTLSQRKQITKTPSSSMSNKLEVVVPMIAVRKGQPIITSSLRVMYFNKQSFTRHQRFNLLSADDIKNIKQSLVAKTDLQPLKPIFWNKLKLKAAASKKSKLSIKFAGEDS